MTISLPSRQRGFFTMPGGMGAARPRGSPYENLSTYTKVDAALALAVTPTRVTAVNLGRSVTTYLYRDFGAGHFNADVSIDFNFSISTGSGDSSFMELTALSNEVGDTGARVNSIAVSFYNTSGALNVRLVEFDGGVIYMQLVTVSAATPYYCRLVRDDNAGTYGTAYLHFATSDANRASGTWSTTLTQALHTSKKDYRYLYAMAGLNAATAGVLVSGYTENFRINAP